VVDAGVLDTFSGNEDGALGMALDPAFEDNHYVYIYNSSGTAMEQKLSRFELHADTEKVMPTVPDDCENRTAFPFASKARPPETCHITSQRAAANGNDLRGKILRVTPKGRPEST
jgi:cytochrome c